MEKIKVLLVEDEPTLAMIIKDTLDGNEFDITLAANGEEGLSRYAEINPDIIVADIMMPKMDGFTMVKLIRKTDTHTCPIPIGPFRGQRRGRGLRDRRQRLPEKAFRHGGIDRTHQGVTA